MVDTNFEKGRKKLAERQKIRKAGTRARILAAAEELFMASSYRDTTTRAIAKKAGVGVGTVFAHFADKPSLAGALVEERQARAMEEAKLVSADLPVSKQLIEIAEVLYRGYGEKLDLTRALMSAALFGGHGETDRFKAGFRDMTSLFMKRIATAKEKGEVSEGLDERIAGRGIYADFLLILIANLQAGEMDMKLMSQQFGLLSSQRIGLAAI